MKRYVFTVLIALLAITSFGIAHYAARTVQAAGSWSAWLYNSSNGQLVHVFPDGAPATTQAIPLPAGTSNPPYSLTISREGAYLAACMVDDANNTTVRVYDLYNSMTVLSQYAAGQVQGCTLTYYAFSEDSSMVAFGLLNHYPDPSDARPEWELIVMDTFAGTVRYRLGSEMPVVATSGIDFLGKMPMLATFEQPTATYPGLIGFRPVLWGSEGSCEYDSVTWNLGDNTVYEGGRSGKGHVDFLLPNSEAIWVEVNDAYPKTTPMGPGCSYNMVMYSNKAGDLYPVFTNGSLVGGTEFVDDGRKIAFYTDSGTGFTQWWAMDRTGATTQLPADIQAYRVWGTLDGYVFLNSNTGLGGAPEVRYHRFTGQPSPDAFVAWTGNPGESWQIIWVNDLTGGLGLPAFPALITTPPPPPITPAPTGELFVGGHARVNTTEGDMLRVRTGPGTSFAVAFQAAPGEIVSILEGPVFGDGYNWWRIDVPGRGQGWAIEGLQEPEGWLQTLIPVQ
jgi:hypothetical protein